jgi:uncharacterized protein (DUF2237 family)
MKLQGRFFVLLTLVGPLPFIVLSNEAPKNVFGESLQPCSTDPMTGWYRDGLCQTDERDQGTHTICAKMTQGVKLIFLLKS